MTDQFFSDSKSSSKKRHKREVAELICVICKKRYLDKNRFKKHTKKHFRKLNTSTGDSNAGEKSM